jgi:hypothetical protein
LNLTGIRQQLSELYDTDRELPHIDKHRSERNDSTLEMRCCRGAINLASDQLTTQLAGPTGACLRAVL